jgi:hypothetical protein
MNDMFTEIYYPLFDILIKQYINNPLSLLTATLQYYPNLIPLHHTQYIRVYRGTR